MGFFDTVSDLFGGGSEYTPDGGPSTNRSSNYSYSDLGGSPFDNTGPAPSPPSYSPPSYSDLGPSPGFPGTPAPDVQPPSSDFGASDFSLGFGGGFGDVFSGGGDSGGGGRDDDRPSSSPSPSPKSTPKADPPGVPGVPDFVAIGGGTSAPDTRPRPDPDEVAKLGKPDFVFDYQPGFTPETIDDFSPKSFDDTSVFLPIVGVPPAQTFDQQAPVSGDATQKQFDALTMLKEPKTEQDFKFRDFLGNIFKNLGSGAKNLGEFISNLTPVAALRYLGDFLRGDPNYKGPSLAQQDLFNVPGPGSFVGGGVPSPGGSGYSPMAAPPKDPCPPGFRFDPTLQQCVPLITPNKPVTPVTPSLPPLGQPPKSGGIADVYPFTLKPPIGKPIGLLPPIQFAPK